MNSKTWKLIVIAGVHVAVIGSLAVMEGCKPKSKTTPAVTPPPGATTTGAVPTAPEVAPPVTPAPVTTAPAFETKPALPPLPPLTSTYTVVKGDTLSGIAHKQGTTVSAIKRANNLSSDVIRAGQKLTVPTPSESGQKEYRAAAPKKTVAKKSAKAPSKKAAPAASGAAAAATAGQYTVVQGDMPQTIAKKLGIKTKDLMDANPGLDPKKLQIGQKLNVPGAAPGAPAASGVGAGATVPEPPATVPSTAPSTLPTEPPSTPSMPTPPPSGPSTPAPTP
jgi:LysM repeat protein